MVISTAITCKRPQAKYLHKNHLGTQAHLNKNAKLTKAQIKATDDSAS